MTCIREGISFCSSAISEDPECLMTTILLKSRKLQIINFYAPPSRIYSRTDLEKILSHRNSIICGDINAYSPNFGAQYSDARGKIVEDIILTNDLVSLNTGEGTHLTRSGKSTPIDISLVSSNLACRSSWKVLPENLGSDHFLIHITIDGSILHEDIRVHRINLKKVDWKLYQLTCLASLGPDLPTDDLEQNTTLISKCIVEAAVTSSPKPKNCTRKQMVPYWNDDCRSAIKERNQKRNRFLKSRTDEAFVEYKRAKGRAQWVIKTAKRECWQRFCSSFNKSTNLGTLWKTVKSMSGHSRGTSIPPISSIDGSPLDSFGKAEILAKTFAHASSNANLSSAFTNLKRDLNLDLDLERTDNSSMSYPIDNHEVVDALGKCGNSSPGPDGIHYEMIRRLPPPCFQSIVSLFNQSWSMGRLPSSWKKATVIPIPKKGKPPSEPTSYRPISLTSTLCKLFERVIAARLRWFLEKYGLLSSNQAGFRKGRGCSDQIVRLSQDIAASSSKKQMTLGVFLDLEKAFDMVWREGIVARLSQLGIKGKMLRWINDFLQDRSMKVRVGATLSNPQTLDNGTPQGSVLSPLLFIVMLDGLPQPRNGTKMSMYADDIALWTTGRKLTAMASRMQSQLDIMDKFLFENGFRISVNKSCSVLFHRNKSRLDDSRTTLSIAGEQIPMTSTATFLGIILDEKMSGKAQTTAVEIRCRKRLNVMRAITGKSWGTSKSCLLQLYRATIRSILDYGSEALDLSHKQNKRVYDSIQFQALKICCGSMIGTGAVSLQVECCELPLDLRRRKLAANHAIRSLATPDNPVKNCYFVTDYRNHTPQGKLHWKLTKTNRPCPFETVSRLVPDSFQRDITRSLDAEMKRAPWTLKSPIIDTSSLSIEADNPLRMLVAREKIEGLKDSSLLCYTDASKIKDKAGTGIFIPKKGVELSVRVSPDSSISSTELAAIEDCLLLLKTSYQGEDSSIVILSDSLSAIQCLSNRNNAYHNRDIYRILSLISEFKDQGQQVTLVWVPAHVGIPGNEKADSLAKNATTKAQIDRQIPATVKDARRFVARTIEGDWQRRWDSSLGCHQRGIQEQVSTRNFFQCAPRKKEVLISRLRLGRCHLNQYLFQMKKKVSGKCRTCPSKEETISHFLLECPTQELLRHHIRSKLQIQSVDLRTMLSNSASIDLIYHWVKEKRSNLL